MDLQNPFAPRVTGIRKRLPKPGAFSSKISPWKLTLRELEVLARLLAAELLAFNGARVAGHQSFLLESGLVFRIVRNERASDAQADSAHLAGDSAAVGVDFDVPFFRVVENGERKVGDHILNVGMEIFLEIATVDGALAGTRLQDNSSDGVLATTRATVDLFGFCGSNSFILRPRNRELRFRGVGPHAAVPHRRRF